MQSASNFLCKYLDKLEHYCGEAKRMVSQPEWFWKLFKWPDATQVIKGHVHKAVNYTGGSFLPQAVRSAELWASILLSVHQIIMYVSHNAAVNMNSVHLGIHDEFLFD
jgi:hypothetical protein